MPGRLVPRWAPLAAAAVCTLLLLASAASAGWLPPVDISDTGSTVSSPDVALDSEGNATAVWDRWNGSASVVETSFRPAGEGWEPPEVVAEGESPQVVVDRNGNWTVSWERSTGSQIVIETVSRPPGGNWSAPAEIDAVPLGAQPDPWLAVDWEGRNTAVWTDGEVIMSSFRQFPGEWEEPVPLSEGQSGAPQAAMDGRGDATAVWRHYDGSHYVVESSYRPEQGEWGEATLISAPGEEGGNPHVAIDAKGDALVVWRGEDENEERLRAAFRPVNGEWGGPITVSAPGEEVESPRAALDPAGNAVAVWSGERGELGGWDIVHASFKPVDGGWQEPVALSAEGGNSAPSDVVFDESGNAAVVWARWDGTTDRVQAAYRPAGEEWEPAADLSEEGKKATDAVVVLDSPGESTAADGNATAVWVSGEEVPCEAEKGFCFSDTVQAAGYDPFGSPEVEVEVPAAGEVGEPIEVVAPGEEVFAPLIDFGDGESVAGTAATHIYSEPGSYEVTFSGAEVLGYRSSATRTVVIGSSEQPSSGGPGSPRGGASELSAGGTAQPPNPLGSSGDCQDAVRLREEALHRLRRTQAKAGRANGRSARRLRKRRHRQAASLQRLSGHAAEVCSR